MKSLCFTGHRPPGIGGYNRRDLHMNLYHHMIANLERAINRGFVRFISGGALGTDQICACAVLELRDNRKHNIFLEIARPCPSQSDRWPEESQEKFHILCSRADRVLDVSDRYTPSAMQLRNEYMVDNAEVVIAVWNGNATGGTANCIRYAQSKGKLMQVVHPLRLTSKWAR